MKRTCLSIFFAAILVYSCSKDETNNEEIAGENALIGTWSFSELDISTADSPDEIKLANDVLEVLLENGCEVLAFTFNEDKTVVAEAKDFTETGRDVRPDLSGLLIECPENTQITSSIWSLDGDQLTFVDDTEMNETITVMLNGDTMIIPAEIVNEDNLKGAKAIFIKK